MHPQIQRPLAVGVAHQRVEARARPPQVAGQKRQVVEPGQEQPVAGPALQVPPVEEGGCRRREQEIHRPPEERCRHPRLSLDPLGREGRRRGPQGLQPLGALGDELPVLPPLRQEEVDEAGHHHRLGPRSGPQPERPPGRLVGKGPEVRLGALDEHELGAVRDGLAQPEVQDRLLAPCGAVDQHERPGPLQPDYRTGHRVVGQRGHRRMGPHGMVDIIGPDHRPQDLLEEIELLVGGGRRGQAAHRLGAGRGHNRLDPLGHRLQRLVPGDRLQRPVHPPERPGQPGRVMNEAVGEPAPVAEPAIVHRGVLPAEQPQDGVGPHIDPDVAANTTLRAN